MALKNKSEEKNKEVTEEVFTEDTAQADETVTEMAEEIEDAGEENVKEDTAELLVVPGTRAFTEEWIRHLLDVALKRDTSSPVVNIREKKFVIPENIEKYIAISGDVSGGKSTFLNALCCYPICPSAGTTTSICPVELRRVAFPDKERIEICYISKGGERLSDKTGEYKVFSKQVFSPALFEKLRAFVAYLIEKRIIKVDSLRYFENATGSYSFDRNNWRHTMVLLMILFDTYLHEDKQDGYDDYKVACQMKEELFTNLGLKAFNTKEYGMRLYWCSDLIPTDTVIVDLPGTGSATKDSIHTKIVNNYLTRVSSLLFFIDLTGNLKMEGQATLDLFLTKARSQGRDMPELVTFLMNQADTKDEVALQSAIKAFRDNYKNYTNYALYAISAIRGEWLFIDSGIESEKTFMASNYRNIRGKLLVSVDALLDELEEAYKIVKYPFSLNGDDLNYNSASLSDFVGEHIEEYIRKLNFRGTVNLFDDYTKYLSNLCRTVMESIDILINASGVSDKLGKELTDAVYESLSEAQNKMDGNRRIFADDIKKLNIKFSENLDFILKSFNDAYKFYNGETNRNIRAMVQRLVVENGRIYIAQNFLELGKESAINNRKSLIEFLKGQAHDLAWQLTSRTKHSKFGKSFLLLEKEFAREREAYSDFLHKNIGTLLEFPAYAKEKMGEKFEKILSDNNVPAEYFEQTKNIISNVCSLLEVGCEEFADDLTNDSSFEDAIIETTEMFYNGLSEILSPYIRDDGNLYAMNVLNGISKSHWFRADYIEPDKLDTFLNNQYVSDFKDKFREMIDLVFIGVGTGGTADSHLSRLIEAIRRFSLYVSDENMKKFIGEVRKACILLENMGQPEEIAKKLKQYREFADYIKNGFAEDGHYRDIIDYIDASDEPALKESRDGFAAIEYEADSIIEKISDFQKVGENNE